MFLDDQHDASEDNVLDKTKKEIPNQLLWSPLFDIKALEEELRDVNREKSRKKRRKKRPSSSYVPSSL